MNGFFWDILKGKRNNLEQITCECCFAFGTSARRVVCDMGCMWNGCAELWCVVCGG